MSSEQKSEPIQEEEIRERIKPRWFWPSLTVFSILAILIVIVLTMAALRLNRQKKAPLKAIPTPIVILEPTAGPDSLTIELQQQSSSDEISAIEADLEATDLSKLDQELEEIEADLATP